MGNTETTADADAALAAKQQQYRPAPKVISIPTHSGLKATPRTAQAARHVRFIIPKRQELTQI